MMKNSPTTIRRAAALARAALLALFLILLMASPTFFSTEAGMAQGKQGGQDKEGYWKQTAFDAFPYKSDERVTNSVKDGTASLRVADPITRDVFAASGTWSRPKEIYAGGEEVEMELSARIDAYEYHAVEGGMNYMHFSISVCIDEAGLEGTAHSRSVIGLEDGKGNYAASVGTDCGKWAVPSSSLTVSAEFPPGNKDGEKRAIYLSTSSGVARYTYVWTAGPAPVPPVPTGGGTAGKGGKKGSKIPGPGSWWQWLSGTAIAGIIASIMGFLNSLRRLRPVRFPTKPPAGFDPSQQAQDSLITQTLWNMWEDISSVPSYVTDKAKWAYNGVTDINNWIEAMEKLEELRGEFREWAWEQAGKAADYTRKVMNDPNRVFQDLADAQNAMQKFIQDQLIDPMLRDPLGTLKTILGVELWERAMDYRRPLLERLGFSTLAALQDLAILQGISSLKNWMFGSGKQALIEGGKQAVVSEGKQAVVKGVEKKAEFSLIRPGTRLSEADLKRVPKVPGASGKGVLEKLGEMEKSKLNAEWTRRLEEATKKVNRFKRSLKKPDVEERVKAVLEIQKDPLAIRALNDRDKRLIRSFNRQIRTMQCEAMDNTIKDIGADPRRFGVSDPENIERIDVVRRTNPSKKVKAGMDQDMTVSVKMKDGTTFDIPNEKLQDAYDEHFYKAAGSPENTTPKQLGRDCRNVAVDRYDAEAFGLSPGDFDEMQLGKPTSHADTISRTMRYKTEESFTRADELARSGDLKGAMTERWMGQRETVKAFNNQVKTRVDYLRKQASPKKMEEIQKKLALVEGNVKEVERLLNSGASPLQIDDFLRSRGTTAEGLAKKVADVYRGLTP